MKQVIVIFIEEIMSRVKIHESKRQNYGQQQLDEFVIDADRVGYKFTAAEHQAVKYRASPDEPETKRAGKQVHCCLDQRGTQ